MDKHKIKKIAIILALILTVQVIGLCCVSAVNAGSLSRRASDKVSADDSTSRSASLITWLNDKIYYANYNRSRWLYELMTAAGYEVDANKNNGPAIFGLALRYDIVDHYGSDDILSPLDRRFVCSTLVRALDYPSRDIGYLADVKSDEGYMSTAAYFGYFIPDFNNMIHPDKAVTNAEYDSLLKELERYRMLKGKRALSFGDSIMYGTGNDGEGMSEMTAIKYGMTCNDYAVPGATMGECKDRGHIPDQIRKAHTGKKTADVILINGGTNDINHTSLGKLTKGFDMDKTSEKDYTGGFERTLWMLDKYWKGVPVIYVRAHNMDLGDDSRERKYGERAMEIALKWNIIAVDLYKDSGLDTEDPAMRARYTYVNPYTNYTCDSIHPNAVGYAKFYLPPIAQKLDKVFNKEAS